MKRLRRKFLKINLLLIFLFASCSLNDGSSSEVRNFFTMEDIEPPVLLEVQSISENKVRLVFNEEVSPYLDSFEPNNVEEEGFSLMVTLTQTVQAGHQVLLEGRVKDHGGNTTGFSTPVWGYNDELPRVSINEFSTRGEGNNPDRTELLILSDGNIAGLTLYSGIPDDWDIRLVCEPMSVRAGDYIVVWWTESIPDTVKDSADVFNICSKSADNLPGYNGIITLSKSPAQGSDVIDCVIYSNNSMTYEGYGTKVTMERAQKAISNHWWTGAPVNSTGTTATRTFCKSTDTGQWYVCETKGSTFGSENTSGAFTGN